MANTDYYTLFSSTLNGFKELSGNQFIAICPFHDDTNASLSGEYGNGLWNCFACGEKGNAYQFALNTNHPNPKEYISDMNGTKTHTPRIKYEKPNISSIDLQNMMSIYQKNLKDRWDELPYRKLWDKTFIDDIAIGINDDGVLMFAHHNKNGEIINIKTHNYKQTGDGSAKWYLRHKIASYSKDKPLMICEGEKDTICLYKKNYQVTSNTTGCRSLPKKDWDWIKGWRNEIFICYDADIYGKQGAEKLAQKLQEIDDTLKVLIIKWNKDVPDKYDVFDSYMNDNGVEFRDAITKAYTLDDIEELPEQIGGFELIKGLQVDDEVIPDVVQIIEALLPEHHNNIIAGTTGSNKSIFAMNMGMCLANNEDSFLRFKINQKNLKILYVDTEVGRKTMLRRCQKIKATMNWKPDADKRWNMLSKKGTLEDAFRDIEIACTRLKPDVVFLDCLYNITNGADISKAHHISPTLNKIDDLQGKFNITIMCVHHFNKGNHKEGLIIDRMTGSASLQNWLEHCLLIVKTNEKPIRLLNVAKTRDIDYPPEHFKLELIYPTLINRGVVDDYSKYLITEQKKTKWIDVLKHIPIEFTSSVFEDKCTELLSVSDRTARNWLSDMVRCKVVSKIKQGHYRQEDDFVDDRNDDEVFD